MSDDPWPMGASQTRAPAATHASNKDKIGGAAGCFPAGAP
jgi:hypothetical protein